MSIDAPLRALHLTFMIAILGATPAFAADGIESERALSFAAVVGDAPSRYYAPAGLHHPGSNHVGLWRVERESGTRLIKITEPTALDPLDDRKFARQIAALRLGADFGGPQIFGSGQVRINDGRVAYFVEMEMLFSGVAETFTLKGLLYGTPDPGRLEASHMDTLARRLRRLTEEKVFINDVDAIFAPTGEVRWIDTTAWQKRDGRSYDQILFGYAVLIGFIGRISRMASQRLVERYRAEIHSSARLSPDEKVMILSELDQNLAGEERLAAARTCAGGLTPSGAGER